MIETSAGEDAARELEESYVDEGNLRQNADKGVERGCWMDREEW
jgi:hypothetical protein